MNARSVYMSDVRMPQPGEDLRFVLESLQGRPGRDARANQLEGDFASRVFLFCEVNDSHAAGGDQLLYQKPAHVGADETKRI